MTQRPMNPNMSYRRVGWLPVYPILTYITRIIEFLAENEMILIAFQESLFKFWLFFM